MNILPKWENSKFLIYDWQFLIYDWQFLIYDWHFLIYDWHFLIYDWILSSRIFTFPAAGAFFFKNFGFFSLGGPKKVLFFQKNVISEDLDLLTMGDQ